MEFNTNITKRLDEMFETDIASFDKKLVQIAKSAGGKAYLVGGAVRDEILSQESKDRDYCITKIPLEELYKKLQHFIPEAKINEVGKSFGIIKISIGNDEFDIAIPRTDIDRESVKTDPNIPIESDLLRRDSVINSMAKDLETGEIINPPGYDGVSDIKNKILRATGNSKDRFREDPLRILRFISQASRFGFDIEPVTLQGIKENIDLLKQVSPERFYDEFFKGLTKGQSNTQKFFKLLFDTNIGILMFGKDFQPIALDKKDTNPKDFFLAQYIAAFLNGGDFTVMNKKIDEQDYVRVTRWFNNAITNGIDYNKIKEITKHGDKFEFIKTVFSMIDSKTRGVKSKYISNILSKPLIPRQDSNKPLKSFELPVTGGQIMQLAEELGKPLKGKAISDTVMNLIKLYQNGELTVSNDEASNIESIKSVLNDKLLKESSVDQCNRLDIIKKRIFNIYND
jgi:hypothetical protein